MFWINTRHTMLDEKRVKDIIGEENDENYIDRLRTKELLTIETFQNLALFVENKREAEVRANYSQ